LKKIYERDDGANIVVVASGASGNVGSVMGHRTAHGMALLPTLVQLLVISNIKFSQKK